MSELQRRLLVTHEDGTVTEENTYNSTDLYQFCGKHSPYPTVIMVWDKVLGDKRMVLKGTEDVVGSMNQVTRFGSRKITLPDPDPEK